MKTPVQIRCNGRLSSCAAVEHFQSGEGVINSHLSCKYFSMLRKSSGAYHV
jgi:hypothetical protein